MNLNNIAGRILASAGVHEYDPILWVQCLGQHNARGVVATIYAEPAALQVQVRSTSDAALYHADMAGQNNTTRQFYIMSTETSRVDGLARNEGRNGDMLFYRGQWWQVMAVTEDYSIMGWVNARGTLQVKAPDFSASSWWTPDWNPEEGQP